MHNNRFYILLLVALLFSAHVPAAWAESLHEEADSIAIRIAAGIPSGQAVFLKLRCGEYTQALSSSLRKELLARSIDLREVPDLLAINSSLEADSGLNLDAYGLKSALLIDVELQLSWETHEDKSFLAYRSRRIPVHRFVTKQIQLPQYRLQKIDNYDLMGQKNPDAGASTMKLKWFDPLLVSTAVASIIFLLWTIE